MDDCELKRVWFRGDAWGVSAIPGGFEIKIARMYEAPIGRDDRDSVPMLTFLKALSAHFGTDSIDVDNISQGGCETCDWGSSYGHRFQVRGATKNFSAAETTLEVAV